MNSIFAPSCGLLVAGMICLLIGLMVGIRSLFIIRESRGSLRGSGHAILAIVCSLLPFPVVVISMFMVSVTPVRSPSRYNGPEIEWKPQPASRGSRASMAFDALVKDPPPREWFKFHPTTLKLAGPAGGGVLKPVDAAHLRELVQGTRADHLHADQVIRWVVFNMLEKGTDVPILVWIAEMNSDLPSKSTLGTWDFHLTEGRIVVGIRTERPGFGKDIVSRLAAHYTNRMAGIPAQ